MSLNRGEFLFGGIAAAMLVRAGKAGGAPLIDEAKCAIPDRFRNAPIFTTPHCGVNFGFLARRGYFSSEWARRQPKLIREAGANWVTLNTHFCQETFASRKVLLDFDWSSGERELVNMIRALHGEGLHVMLKPCLTSLDSAWMGSVSFPSKEQEQIQGVKQRYAEEWFDSLRQCLGYFCGISEETGCEALIVGAEYNGMTRFDDEWRKTIAQCRRRYSGPVTYEFMPREPSEKKLAWFEDLDFLALSTYPEAVSATPEVRGDYAKWKGLPPIPKVSMMAALAPQRAFVDGLCRRFGNKPLVFSEIGTRSCRGCVNEPGNYYAESIWDGEEQANYMAAVFETFSKLPNWLGLSWWKWDETQHSRKHYSPDPRIDQGFTIYGKPAARVLKKWAKGGFL